MAVKYRLELSPAAMRDLKRLPRVVQREIAYKHLALIQSNPLKVGDCLVGALKGERSYHFGRKPEYRILYLVEDDFIIVTIVGTREGIYKRAQRRQHGISG